LDEAIALSRKINPRITYFTHMSHQIGLHSVIEKQLPPNMLFAYDGFGNNSLNNHHFLIFNLFGAAFFLIYRLLNVNKKRNCRKFRKRVIYLQGT